jgi:hypothetical protein
MLVEAILIERVIGLIENLSSTVVFDSGLIAVFSLLFLAVLIIDSVLISTAVKTRNVIKKFEDAKQAGIIEYRQLSEIVSSSGVDSLRMCWHTNICKIPNNSESRGWLKNDVASLVERTISYVRFRHAARYLPGLFVLFSIIISVIAVMAGVEQNSDISKLFFSSGLWMYSVFMIASGLVSALVFAAIDRFFELLAARAFAGVYRVSSDLLTTVGENDWQQTQIEALNRNASLIENMSKEVTDSIVSVARDNLLPGLEASYRSSIERYLQPEISKLRESSSEYSSKILQVQQSGMTELADSFYQNMSANLDAQLERQSSLIEKLEHMQQVGDERLEHIISRSDDNLSMQRELNSQALLTIEGMSSSKIALTEAAEKLTDGMRRAGELAAAMQELLEADHNLLGELSSERVAMQSINNGYFEKMNNQVLQLQDDLNSEITNLLSRFTDIYSVTFENIEEQTGSLIESFDSQTRSLIDSLDEQVRDLTFLTKDVTAEIADLNKNLKDSTSEFASNVNSSLNGHLSSLDSSVNELMTKLASTTELIRESVDDLPAAVLLARMSIDKASDSVEDSD